MKKSKHGGKRQGAGRKEKSDPSVQITIRVPKSHVERHGGYSAAKIKAQEFLISSAK